MADYELHADYDHDGRLRATPAEHGRRQETPGAILLPNLDVDAHQLPRQVAGNPGRRRKLDGEQTTKSRSDNDLLPLLVRVVRPTAPPGSRLVLRVTGAAAGAVRLYDAKGRAVTRSSFSGTEYELPLEGDRLELSLEATTLPGSPLTEPIDGDPRQLELELIGPAPGGRIAVLDRASVSIAPFLIADNTAEVEEIYICELLDNEPTRRDLEGALGQTSMSKKLRTIPATQARDDGWVQDQFQHGYCQAPGGWMHMLLHLPRLASNVVQSGPSPNLASFVTSHFPSHDLGLFDDFWRRPIPVRDGAPPLSFESSYEVFQQMQAVDGMRAVFLEVHERLKLETARPAEPASWLESRQQLGRLVSQAVEALRRLEEDARRARRLQLAKSLHFEAEALQSRVRTIDSTLPLAGAGVTLTPPQGAPVLLGKDELERLFRLLQRAHNSLNFGGNVEVSPPTGDKKAPHGRIVIGTSQAPNGKAMDPDLYRFLRAQKAQPLVEVDTSWLDVGHVDELLTFVPDRRKGDSGFAILRASPGVALALIRAARDRHQAGLPDDHEYKKKYFFSDFPRHTDQGKTPVSHLLRGKLWLHHHPRGALEVLDPPRIYRQLAAANSRLELPIDTPFPEIAYHPGEEVDRLYAAGISVHEVLHFEQDRQGKSVNAFIEEELLRRELDGDLGTAFPGSPILRLPVLFDRIGDLSSWEEGAREEQTVAFTPNLVNLQVLGDHLLLPRPYGPRMRPSDAVCVLRQVLRAEELPGLAARIDKRFFSKRKLDRTLCWLRREEPIIVEKIPVGRAAAGLLRRIFQGIASVDDVVAMFQDGFPGKDRKEVRRKILKDNEKHFRTDGQLRPGWRLLTIPEGTVDLFEAYTQVLAESLGLRVHWVDSWFYHVRMGELHCGTNVIRRPPIKSQAPWWRA